MKIVSSLFVCSALGLLATPSHGQIVLLPSGGASPDAVIRFSMPQDRDPSRLTYTQEGKMYTNADNASPGDNVGAVITGQLLATNSANVAPGGGLEVHSQIPSSVSQAGVALNIPVVEVDFFTTYTGNLEIISEVAYPYNYSPGYTPWNIQRIAAPNGSGYAQGFRFLGGGPTQAPLVNSPSSVSASAYFALLTATVVTPSDPTGFTAAKFGFDGFTTIQNTPEPGALALLGSSVLGGAGMAWRRKRTMGRARKDVQCLL